MNNNNNSDSVRVAIVSALAAITVGLLAILHDKERFLGFFVVDSGFIVQIYNFIIVLLFIEIFLCIAFLSSTGFMYSFKDEKHSLAKWIQKTAYYWMIGFFPFSFVSIIYNIVAKMLGLDTWVSIGVFIAVIVAVIIMLLLIICIRIRGGHKKRG